MNDQTKLVQFRGMVGNFEQILLENGKIEGVFRQYGSQKVHTKDGNVLSVYDLKRLRRAAGIKAKKFVRAKKPRSSGGQASRELIAQYTRREEKKSSKWAEQLQAALS